MNNCKHGGAGTGCEWLRIAAYAIWLRFKGLPKLAAELPLKSGFNGPTCVGLISFMEA